jgi:predicted MPP superfamily phosphohydrolase
MRGFLTIVLIVWTGMHAYVFWRLKSIPVFSRVPGYAFAIVGSSLWASYIIAHVLDHFLMARFLEVIGANWVGIVFLLLITFLVVDVVTLFGWLWPNFAATLRIWALVTSAILSSIALVQGHRAPVIDRYEVPLAGLPADMDGTVLILASDFHLGTRLGKDWLEARVQQMQAEHPDIIVLAGDIVEGDNSSERELLSPLWTLRAPLGVWGVDGNHEFDEDNESRPSVLQDNGVRVLRDSWAEIRPGLILAGVKDLTSRHRHGQTGSFVQRALQGRPNKGVTIFLSHTPWEVETVAHSDVGLMLSGHTHEGQIWPFGYLVGITHPFLAGRYEVNGMTLIVCRGTGTWGPRMRLWRRGQIARITLRNPEATQQ